MPDLRYHLFYFIAIFLMLGVGMLVGGSFYGPAQVRQQQKSLANLRIQVDGAVQDGRRAKAELAATETALDGARPVLVRGKLAGRHIVVLQTGDDTAATQDAVAAVQDAGAQVTATVVLSGKWQTQDDRTRVSGLSQLAAALTEPAATGSDVLQSLQDRGLITVTGTPGGASGLMFVFVGGGAADSAGPIVDADLITQIKASVPGTILAYAEASQAAVSFIPTYQSANVSTVDCIDRPIGKLALPFALRGDPDAGDYGLKPTAHLTLPPSLSAHE